jgi:hypothetical protein
MPPKLALCFVGNVHAVDRREHPPPARLMHVKVFGDKPLHHCGSVRPQLC